MARVTFINAILSGKLAGTIYARNKSGQYVKQYSKPLDPKSTAQLQNRSIFSSCAGLWHALTDYQKGLWNSFGTTIFVPKMGVTGSPSSGFNAFVSLQNSVRFGSEGTRTTTVLDPAGTTVTNTAFSSPTVPPIAPLSGNIQTNIGGSLPILMTEATITGATYATTAVFTFPSIQATVPKFLDAVSDKPVGIMLQMSIPQVQVAGFVQGKNIQTLGVWAPPTLTNAAFSSDTLEIGMSSADSRMTEYKTQVQTDQIVEISAYLISENGEQRHIGTVKTTVL